MGDKEDQALLEREYLSWLQTGEADTHELSELWPDVRIEAEEIAVTQIERLVEFRERAQADKLWWLDAVRSAHLALTAAMVAALEGSSGVGAMTPKSAEKTLKWLGERERAGPTIPKEHTLPFVGLVEAIQEPDRLQFGSPVELGPGQIDILIELNWYRELIDHPKFTRWSVPVEALEEATSIALTLIEPLMSRAPAFYYRDAVVRVRAALQRAGHEPDDPEA